MDQHIEQSKHANPLELIDSELVLSRAAQDLVEKERHAPRDINQDASLRMKVLDQCGMACTFCHNEGTPVSADNRSKTAEGYQPAGASSRVSIYLSTNGADFLSGMMRPDNTFSDSFDRYSTELETQEVHLTGGEPTLHPHVAGIVKELHDKGMRVKMTSNGERFYAIAEELKDAGLDKVVFSIFGTTPKELAAVQGDKYSNEKFASLKLRALRRSIAAAHEVGIPASANIVMPDSSHADRVKSVIEEFGDTCKIRILNSLDGGAESYASIYELLAELGAEPIRVNITAGASGMSVDYRLADGKEVGFKQIRRSYLEAACGSCALRASGCEEGYYGVRMYVGEDGLYRAGVCIQRMDLTKPLDEFLASGMPAAIRAHRVDEYKTITHNI